MFKKGCRFLSDPQPLCVTNNNSCLIIFFLYAAQGEDTLDKSTDDEVPTMKRRRLPRGWARKRAIAVKDRESGTFSLEDQPVFYFL